MPLRPIDPIAREFGGKNSQTQSANYAVGGGSANVYTFALKPPIPGPVVGMPVRVKIPVTNTGPSTLNGVAIKHLDGTDVVPGELAAGNIYEFVYNGSVYQLQTETVSPFSIGLFPPLSAPPANPTTGRAYFDTTLGYPRIWNGTSWFGFLLS